MKAKSLRTAALVASVLLPGVAGAQQPEAAPPAEPKPAAVAEPASTPEPARWRFDIEVDPLTFILEKGYSGLVGVKPAALPDWRFGAGFFSAEFGNPEVLDAKNLGFGVRIDPAVALTAHYFLGKGRSRFYTGGALLYINYLFRHTGTQETVRLNRYAVSAHLGFQWIPFENVRFYIQPFIHLSAVFGPGTATLAGATFEERAFSLPYSNPVSGSLLIHIGYEI